MGDVVLSVRDVTKTFGPVRAVDELSFAVRRGTITGLLGRNGAGKTTTLRMINGIFLPDSGTIELFGTSDAAATRDRVGYLPEERGLYRKMRVIEQLLFLAAIKGRRPADVRPAAERWLKRFELWDKRAGKLEELSKGNQQKVQLIGALLHDPEVVTLDEPTSGLDPVNVVLVRTILKELEGRGEDDPALHPHDGRGREAGGRDRAHPPGQGGAGRRAGRRARLVRQEHRAPGVRRRRPVSWPGSPAWCRPGSRPTWRSCASRRAAIPRVFSRRQWPASGSTGSRWLLPRSRRSSSTVSGRAPRAAVRRPRGRPRHEQGLGGLQARVPRGRPQEVVHHHDPDLPVPDGRDDVRPDAARGARDRGQAGGRGGRDRPAGRGVRREGGRSACRGLLVPGPGRRKDQGQADVAGRQDARAQDRVRGGERGSQGRGATVSGSAEGRTRQRGEAPGRRARRSTGRLRQPGREDDVLQQGRQRLHHPGAARRHRQPRDLARPARGARDRARRGGPPAQACAARGREGLQERRGEEGRGAVLPHRFPVRRAADLPQSHLRPGGDARHRAGEVRADRGDPDLLDAVASAPRRQGARPRGGGAHPGCGVDGHGRADGGLHRRRGDDGRDERLPVFQPRRDPVVLRVLRARLPDQRLHLRRGRRPSPTPRRRRSSSWARS